MLGGMRLRVVLAVVVLLIVATGLWSAPPAAKESAHNDIIIARLQLRESTLRVDPMADFNLSRSILKRTNLLLGLDRAVVELKNDDIFNYPFLVFCSEHGKMNLNDLEREKIRRYLVGGGFIYIDDCNAKLRLRSDLRGEINALAPKHQLKPIPLSHPLYRCYYDIKRIVPARRGGPRYHEGLEIDGRLALVYSLNGEGCSWQSWKWAGPLCSCLPSDYDYAFEFGTNLLFYALTH